MNLSRWIAASLWFHRRSSLALVAGAALTAALLTGALAVGDSMRFTLAQLAAERLGRVQFVIDPQGRFFSADLAPRLAARLTAPVAAVLQTAAAATQPDSGLAAHQVRVYGVDRDFWPLAAADPPALPATVPAEDRVLLNAALAQVLQVQTGQALVLRLDKPGAMSRDAPLSTAADDSVAVRVTVAGIVPDAHGGRFSLQADSAPPRIVYVDRRWLQENLQRPDAANLLLVGAGASGPLADEQLRAALHSECRLADLELEVQPFNNAAGAELTSRHVFLDPHTLAAARGLEPPPQEVLTYFVNAIEVGDRTTPYAFVTAVDPRTPPPAATTAATALPADLADDGIVFNAWLAADLDARVGDRVRLRYYVMGPRRQLIERQTERTLRAILPMTDPWCERGLMPAYPGIVDSDNCRDWTPGIPIDLDKIRDQDETYWDEYRGTPKAFLTLSAGTALWDNRFGNRTALRWPDTPPSAAATALTSRLDPARYGLQPRGVATAGRAASRSGTDFGGLFVGLSFFLIVAALILVALVYRFQLQARAAEIGVLLALGLPRALIRRMFLLEAALTATVGAALGAAAGLLYTRLLVWGLNHGWQGAVNAAEVRFAFTAETLLLGGALAAVTALAAMSPALRACFRRPVRELLSPGMDLPKAAYAGPDGTVPRVAGWLAPVAAAASLIAAAIWAARAWFAAGDPTAAFMGIGALLLMSGLSWQAASLQRRACAAPSEGVAGLAHLAWRNAGLRWGRSLAAIGLIACGCFLVVAVGSGRQDPAAGALNRNGGAGGFGLCLETSLPLFFDLNTPAGQAAYGLEPSAVDSTLFVPLRVHAGDDASCLNLNRAQAPRLLGVPPQEFDRRNAFHFLQTAPEVDAAHPWRSLTAPATDLPMPAIGDEATVYWALGKSVGDLVTVPDGQGGELQLKIVGMLQNSILQGALIVDEAALIRHFPAESGYRLFLIDTAPESAAAVRRALATGLRDYGPEIATGAERLRRFHAVEETYLAIFGLLGGLAMALGCLGLGLVLVRNALERRAELAILRVVGFSLGAVQRLLWLEFGVLLATGWSIGVMAAAAALAPTLARHAAGVAWLELAGLLSLLLILGFGSIAVAARWAVRGPLLSALRQE